MTHAYREDYPARLHDRHQSGRGLAAAAVGLLVCSAAHADGIDIAGFVLRYSERDSLPVLVAKIVLFLAVNYTLNYLVVGVPAGRYREKNGASIPLGIGYLTLFGQITDRLGAILALFTVQPVCVLLGRTTVQEAGTVLFFLTFLYSGAGFYLLCLYTLRHHLKLEATPANLISLAAGLVCNPAWVLVLIR